MLEAIANFFRAVGEITGLIRQRDAEKNTAPMQAQAKGQVEADAEKKTNEAIANKDTDEIRRELAE